MILPKRSELELRYGKIVNFNWSRELEFMTFIPVPAVLWKRFQFQGNQVRTIYCNEDMAVPLADALQNVIKRNLIDSIHSYDGCFSLRNARGSDKLSVHSYGLAIDLNAPLNPLGRPSNQNPELIKCFTDEGFVWGGTWERPDPMHLQFCEES